MDAPQLKMTCKLESIPDIGLKPGYLIRTMAQGEEWAWAQVLNSVSDLGEWTVERARSSFDGEHRVWQAGVHLTWYGDEPVATTCVQLHDQWADFPELGWVATHPDHQGKGLGTAMCATVMKFMREHGYERCYLTTDDHRLPAIKSYINLGFRPCLEHPSHELRWRDVLGALKLDAAALLTETSPDSSAGPIRVGLVGARCRAFIEGFKANPDAHLTAFCDIDEQAAGRAANEFGIPMVYRVYEDMLESDIDAVVIGTPMHLHAPMALQALQAGKHVLSEVTAGVTMDELSWLCREVERTGKTYMMAENYCYMPENQLINSLVQKGYFGEVYYGEGEYIHELKGLHHMADGRNTWREWWQMGRSGNTYPTHSLGPVMQWFGDDSIESVSCFSPGRRTAPEHVQEDTTITMCQMASGKLIRIRLDMLSNRPHNMTYYSLQGTKGCYEASRGLGDKPKIWLADFSDGDSPGQFTWRPLWDFREHLPERYLKAEEAARTAGHGGGDYFQVYDFVESIINGTRPPIDVYTAAEWTAVAFLSAESLAKGGVPVRMPKFR